MEGPACLFSTQKWDIIGVLFAGEGQKPFQFELNWKHGNKLQYFLTDLLSNDA